MKVMYLKLSIRNAKRSIMDYLLYIVTMVILLSIMEVSNCIAIIGKVQAGFQTVSLPILITIILVIIVGYIDFFMLKQRAKEFANYLLLGMEKNKLSFMFLCEFLIIGIVCFVIGAMIGLIIFVLLCVTVLPNMDKMNILLFGKSLLQTFLYFCFAEVICSFRIRCNMNKLQISELVYEKVRSQNIRNRNSYKKYRYAFLINLMCFMGILCGMIFLPKYIAFPIISVISIPLLCLIFAFYKYILGYLYAIREEQCSFLYRNNRLYMIAQITAGVKTNAVFNGVFCICLLFSAASFFFGAIMFQPSVKIFDTDKQQWMGFVQISLCIIFIVIYFSILSLQQIVELRQEAKSIKVLYYVGKNGKQVKKLIKTQIAIKLLMPMTLAFFILLVSVPLVNLKLNMILPSIIHNMLLKFVCWFAICFILFYFCYFFVVYTISNRYIGTITENITKKELHIHSEVIRNEN